MVVVSGQQGLHTLAPQERKVVRLMLLCEGAAFLVTSSLQAQKDRPSCVISKQLPPSAMGSGSSPRRPEDPQDKCRQKERLTRQGGGRRGFRTLRLGYCLRKAGQAYSGFLALSSMGSMANAIRMGTMRCWGPRGPKTEPLPVSQEIFTLIEV